MPRKLETARARGLLIVALGSLVASISMTAPASAATVSPVETSYDRPAVAYLTNGTQLIAWAGTDSAGKVNLVESNTSGILDTSSKLTVAGSSTYPGTGTAAAYDSNSGQLAGTGIRQSREWCSAW